MDILNLLPQTGGIIVTLATFVATLAIIVFVHEYGHYIVGRWCGIKAEVFSMGFGPVLKTWVDKRGTRWQIAAFPVGGYVRFKGDADAASGVDGAALREMDAAERATTMHGAALYKRALTVLAGPVFNFILSIVVFSGMVMYSGFAVEQPTIGTLKPLPAGVHSFQPGDRIIAINDTQTPDYEALYDYAGEAAPTQQVYTVERDGEVLTLDGPFPLLPLIGSVTPRSAAAAAGLQVGDVIQSVDGQDIAAFSQLQDIVGASGGRPLMLKVWRDGHVLDFTLSARVSDIPDGNGGFEQRTLIGITGSLFFDPATYRPSPVAALETGAGQTWRIVTLSLSALQHVVTGDISRCNIQGPVGIAQASAHAAGEGFLTFIWFIAMLSTAIGLVNLFPIPVLDGGHLVFFAYEAITRRPPSDRVVQVMMVAGLVLVLGAMLFAFGNDFSCP